MNLQTIRDAIADLTSKETELQQEYETVKNDLASADTLDKKSVMQLPTIQAQLQVIGTRLGLLQQDEQTAQYAADLAEYDTLSQQAYEHYTEVSEIDAEVKQLQQQLNELIKKKSTMEAEYHTAKYRRIKLRTSLNQSPLKDEMRAIEQRFNGSVPGYL